jgi:hypothetical protein
MVLHGTHPPKAPIPRRGEAKLFSVTQPLPPMWSAKAPWHWLPYALPCIPVTRGELPQHRGVQVWLHTCSSTLHRTMLEMQIPGLFSDLLSRRLEMGPAIWGNKPHSDSDVAHLTDTPVFMPLITRWGRCYFIMPFWRQQNTPRDSQPGGLGQGPGSVFLPSSQWYLLRASMLNTVGRVS